MAQAEVSLTLQAKRGSLSEPQLSLLLPQQGFRPVNHELSVFAPASSVVTPIDIPEDAHSPDPEADVAGVSIFPYPLQDVTEGTVLTPLSEAFPNHPTDSVNPFTAFAPPSPSLPKAAAPSLRLPSFEALGIAAPHPDRKVEAELWLRTPLGAGPPSKPEDPLHINSPMLAQEEQWHLLPDTPESKADSMKPDLVPHAATTVTPPYETSPAVINWGTFPPPTSTAIGSPPPSQSSESEVRPTDLFLQGEPESSHSQYTGPSDSESWIDTPLRTILSTLADGLDDTANSIKVLSHALPCPCAEGHSFPKIISEIHDRMPPRSTWWINVFHALPGRFNIADVPVSPPSTPGPAIGGDDYFTKKIFDSAVQVSDHQSDSHLVASPHAIVAPMSVDVSIVERYIPPTNTKEFIELFSPNASRSLLLDRLYELSPKNGCLLFIYPTRHGGRTFRHDYLGPLLDPILRSMTVVHDLSTDLSMNLGSNGTVDALPDFEEAKSRLENLCYLLSNRSNNIEKRQMKRSKFSLTYSDKVEVPLERKTWAEHWWVKQEKPRVREAVTKYYRKAKRLPVESEVVPSSLIQEILDGVAHRQSYNGDEPTKGVEVGVFVIRKSEPDTEQARC